MRSTVVALPLILVRDHAFDPATEATDCAGRGAAEAGFFAAGSASFAVGLRMRKGGRNLSRIRRLQELLEVAVFAEAML